MSEEHRVKIQNSNILNCLVAHVQGNREMSSIQVSAGAMKPRLFFRDDDWLVRMPDGRVHLAMLVFSRWRPAYSRWQRAEDERLSLTRPQIAIVAIE